MIRGLRRNKDPMASPPYLSHFKLREAPFAASGGAKFFYADPERAQTLNMLQHLTQYSEELLLVSGPAGSGKTSLLEQYLARADDDWKVCRVSAAEISDPGLLFLTAARCFGLHTEGLSSDGVIDALREHLNQLQQNMTPVLVVDAAERLSDDGLEVVVRLAELAGDHGKLVRTILFAEPAIMQRLTAARFANVPKPHVLELKPLEEAQLPAYLHHRLAAAGYSGSPLFTARDIKRIYKESQGWPGGINAVAHGVLMDKRKGTATPRWRPMVWGGAVVGLVIGGYIALFTTGSGITHFGPVAADHAGKAQPTAEKPIVRVAGSSRYAPASLTVRSGETLQITCAAPNGSAATILPLVTQQPAIPMPVPATTVQVAKTQAVEAQATKAQAAKAQAAKAQAAKAQAAKAQAAKAQAAKAQAAKAQAAKAQVAKAQVAKTQAAKTQAMAPSVERIEPKPVPGRRGRQTLTIVGKHFTSGSWVTVAWDGRRKRLATSQVRVIDGGRIAIAIAVGTQPAEWTLVVRAPNGLQSAPFRFRVQPTPTAGVSFNGARWVYARNPHHFTVQLVGATTKQGVISHINGHHLSGPSALVVTRREGKSWYVLLWGDFPDRAAAERRVAQLSPALKRVGPWVRPFAEVQVELRRGGVAAQ